MSWQLLVQVAGLNILTDPVWSKRVSPVTFAGPKRVRDPGIPIEALPEIDLILDFSCGQLGYASFSADDAGLTDTDYLYWQSSYDF